MKKILILFLIFLSVSINSFATNKLGWDSGQATRWAAMKAGNHAYYQKLVTESSGSFSHEDGMRDAILCRLNNSSSNCYDAWKHIRDKGFRGINFRATTGKVPDPNTLRDVYLTYALVYSMVADDLPAQDKTDFKDTLTFWYHLALNDGVYVSPGSAWDPRMSDSDQATGCYMGLVVFALAIQDEDPTLSSTILGSTDIKGVPVGGYICTDADFTSWCKTMNLFAQRATGGMWAESGAAYNLNTIKYFAQGVQAIRNFSSGALPNLDNNFWNILAQGTIDELSPNFSDVFNWGDTEDANVHTPNWYKRLGVYSSLSGLVTDATIKANLYYLIDLGYSAIGTSFLSSFYPDLDGYSTRTRPSGRRSINSGQNGNIGRLGKGTAFWHEGPSDWASADSFWISEKQNFSGLDHDPDYLSNWNVWRKRATSSGWAMTNPKGYYDPDKTGGHFQNTVLPNGSVSKWIEGRAQTAYNAGTDYMYHAGTYGGNPLAQNTGFANKPCEFVHEDNDEVLFFKGVDDSDTVFWHVRMNATDPRTVCNYNSYPNTSAKHIRQRIDAMGAKHQIVFNIPTSTVTTVGNKRSWTAPNGETARLWSFLTSPYDATVIDVATSTGSPYLLTVGNSMLSSEKKKQLRLQPTQINGHQTFLNVFNAGADPTVTNFHESSGSDIDGSLVKLTGQDVFAVFSAHEATYETPTANGGKNSNKAKIINQYRFIQDSFQFSLSLTNNAVGFISDLEPTKTWIGEYSSNNGSSWNAISGFSVDAQTGFSRFSFNHGSGDFLIRVYEGTPPDPPVETCGDTNVCEEGETCQTCGECCDPEIPEVVVTAPSTVKIKVKYINP